MKTFVHTLSVGTREKFKGGPLTSAYRKTPTRESLKVWKTHLEGNEVANIKYHGGADRVVHQYCQEHYADFQQEFPEIAELFVPSSLGENITVPGWNEDKVCIGDIVRVGSALLQVTEPRNPCGTINLNFNKQAVMQSILRTGHCGWFYRVLEEGEICVEDSVELSERIHPDLSVRRVLMEVKVRRGRDKSLMARLQKTAELSQRYRDWIGRL